jgi:hypothetical protein
MPHVPVSRLLELKDALLAAMQAAPGLTDAHVLWDIEEDPGDGERDVVGFIDDLSEQERLGMRQDGANQRSEALSVRVAITHVKTYIGADAARRAEGAAMALAQAVADAVDAPGLRPFGALYVARIQREGYRRQSDGQWEQRVELDIRAPAVRLRRQP